MIIRTTKQIVCDAEEKMLQDNYIETANKEWVCLSSLQKEIEKMKFKSSSPMFDMGASTAIQEVLKLCKSPEQKESSPVQNPKCECNKKSILNPLMADWYSEEELPFVEHLPNECKCTNELKQYKRNNKIVWLCSNCCQSGDVLCVQNKCTCKKPDIHQIANSPKWCGRCGGAL